MTLNWYSHKTQTRRKHWDGHGFWSKAHILDGPYRDRIEGEQVRFICGHEADSLTMPVKVGTVMTCKRCLKIAASRGHKGLSARRLQTDYHGNIHPTRTERP